MLKNGMTVLAAFTTLIESTMPPIRLRAILFPVFIFFSCECFAGVTPPVDIIGLAALLGGFVILVIVLAIAGIWSSIARALLLLAIAAPVAIFGTYAVSEKWNHNRIEAAIRENENAFSQLCKARKKIVHQKASALDGNAIYLTNFANSPYPPVGVPELLALDQVLCNESSVRHMEQYFETQYAPEKKAWNGEIRLYDTCNKNGYKQWKTSPLVTSKYEMIYGEEYEFIDAPNPLAPVRMLWKSVRVLERNNGITLAEDRLYYFGSSRGGDGGCPKPEEQILELVKEVFPRE